MNLWKATCKAWVRKSYMNEDKLYEKCGEVGTLKTKLAAAEARIALLERVLVSARSVCSEEAVKEQMPCYNMGINLFEALKACEEK